MATELDKDPVRARLDRLAGRHYAPLASFFRKRNRDTGGPAPVQQLILRLTRYREMDEIPTRMRSFSTASNTPQDHFRISAVQPSYPEQIAMAEASGSAFSPDGAGKARASR